ncbi:MAG TPA: hypothetical protein ENI77_05465 [Nitrospirae bacterium]|nr:hypothetical protein [Nitrospirota bacterium]
MDVTVSFYERLTCHCEEVRGHADTATRQSLFCKGARLLRQPLRIAPFTADCSRNGFLEVPKCHCEEVARPRRYSDAAISFLQRSQIASPAPSHNAQG